MKLVHWVVSSLVLAGAAYLVSRNMRSAVRPQDSSRAAEMAMPATAEDGLLWLKTEFHLSEAEYERIRSLHEAYLPGCQQRCLEIARVRKELFVLIQKNRTVTPEVKAKLEESAALRARCGELMLAHFYDVAATMPPQAASRYLEWVTRETLMN